MEEFRYDTYCGLYCGACDTMAAFKKSIENGNTAIWEDLPLAFRKNLPMGKVREIICYGCKSDTVFGGCSICPVRKCARETMHVESCDKCTKHPCLRYGVFKLFQRIMKKRLPHLSTAKPNRAIIKEQGVGAWLAQQEEAWRCPHCKTSLTWYGGKCTNCG
jgi:hypothetical protein